MSIQLIRIVILDATQSRCLTFPYLVCACCYGDDIIRKLTPSNLCSLWRWMRRKPAWLRSVTLPTGWGSQISKVECLNVKKNSWWEKHGSATLISKEVGTQKNVDKYRQHSIENQMQSTRQSIKYIIEGLFYLRIDDLASSGCWAAGWLVVGYWEHLGSVLPVLLKPILSVPWETGEPPCAPIHLSDFYREHTRCPFHWFIWAQAAACHTS